MRPPTPLKQLRGDLLTEVANEGQKLGFKLNRTYYSFRKKTSFGWQAFGISPIVHLDIDFDINVTVSIGFDALTELLNRYDSSRDDEQRGSKFHFGAELGNITERRPKRHTVTTSADIKPVTDAVMHDFTVYGMPYLEKYSSLENVLEDIRVDEDRWKGFLLMPFHDLRAKYAIAIAYLLGQYESFRQIAAAKEAYLISMNAPGLELESFRKFRNELEVHFKR